MELKDRIFHVISNTHWDREWRFPFEKNRQMLVEMIDQVLEILRSDPTYRAFHLDSQSIVLDDYLEIRPEKRELIRKFVEDRRLLIGPWYVLPDEFLVGGENLIRNLLLGHETCAGFGHVMKVGYSPFSWGQISQLPQLYSGFGVSMIMFYRGVNSLDSPQAEFLWEGADGTRTITSRFSTMPRYNFYFYIYRPVIHNEAIADVEYKWTRGGTPFHFIDRAMEGEDYYLLNPVDGYYKDNIVPSVEAIIEQQLQDFTTEHVFWAEGHDSSGPNPKTPKLIRDIRQLMPEVNVQHSTLEDYAEGLLERVQRDALPVVKGERRSSQYDRRSGNMYAYTTSARMYLKQKNFEAEKWLQFYAEPFNAFAGMLGLSIRDQYLPIAWKTLIANSAHDSIGGCSLDGIHEDMMNRSKRVIEISKGVFDRAVKYFVKRIDLSAYEPESVHVVAINPTQFVRSEVVEASVDLPVELDGQGAIDIVNDEGERMRLQVLEESTADHALEQMIDRPMYMKFHRTKCLIELKDLPSYGYKTFHVASAKPSIVQSKEPKLAKMVKGLPVMENEFLKVLVQKNGALTVIEKETEKKFKDIAYFYDEGEAGHAWTHEAVKPLVTTLDAKPEVTLERNGPLSARVRIRHEMKLPVDLAARTVKRGVRTVLMPVELTVTLNEGARRLELHVDLTNTAESHRLRLMFPTGLDAPYSYGEGGFDVVKRSTLRPDTSSWIEQPMYDYPMHHFVDVSDGETGAAVLVSGLKEYEVMEDKAGTLAVTLFRAFRYIIQPSSLQDYSDQKGSQCLGAQSYDLAFYPHKGLWNEAGVYEEALRFNNEIRVCETGRTEGALPSELSLLNVTPGTVIVSAVKETQSREENAWIVRFYNPTERAEKAEAEFYAPLKKAEVVSLEELVIKDLALLSTYSIEVDLPPKKIVTVKITTGAVQ
ncbi:MAG: alpha-mannosidase [Acidobacteriota bacterium]